MKPPSHRTIRITAIIIAFILVGIITLSDKPQPRAPAQETPQISVTLIINYNGHAENQEQELQVTMGTTVFQILTDNAEIEYQEYTGMGALITSINSVAQDHDTGLYWMYYVNNEYAPVGVSSYAITDPVTIEFKYEASPF